MTKINWQMSVTELALEVRRVAAEGLGLKELEKLYSHFEQVLRKETGTNSKLMQRAVLRMLLPGTHPQTKGLALIWLSQHSIEYAAKTLSELKLELEKLQLD